MSEPSSANDDAVNRALGLTQVVAKPLERVPVRQRESSLTTSAWRLEIACDQGRGGIALIELTAQHSFFRGDGIFLGWSQERLGEAYRMLTELGADDSHFELLQLG
jgi:hypothetical protein